MSDFLTWASNRQSRIEGVLATLLPDPSHAPGRLYQAMRYAVLDGGKRVRPLLAYAAGELTRAEPACVDAVAAAVEFIHAYSLVHDDMPAMDNDVIRRGKPTVHVEFDEATALLVGDALQSLAFKTLSQPDLVKLPAMQVSMLNMLAKASGSAGMAGGQAIDLASVGKPIELTELEFMHILKTGALIRASVNLGAMCGEAHDPNTMKHLDHYAKCIGLAFQVVDDVLDAEAPTAMLGKTAGKDAANNKPTYVSLLGLARSRELAEELRADALSALSGFGPEAERLRQLADYVILRKH
ncbi:MAG: polyprenyl synthetase family protein [Hydrogenophilaceae bacterium]|nr:polyprenyl synthetase family protein [Hydrogenophilaceae bacterium]